MVIGARRSRLRPRARTGTLGTVLGRGDAPDMTIAARSGVIPEHRFLQALFPNKALMVEQARDDAPGGDVDDEQCERDAAWSWGGVTTAPAAAACSRILSTS